MTPQRFSPIAVSILLLLAGPAASAADGKAALDPRSRPDERLMDQTMRYYVWHDAEGWHLRSAAKGLVKFEGAIRAIDGKFGKCRPVGLETKGTGADRWAIDGDRKQVSFSINTSTSFDGFDFDVPGATEVEFELSMNGQKRPQRIFVGRKGVHPKETKFRLPADPDKVFSKPAEKP